MRYLPQLFSNNRAWAARRVGQDPDFFRRLCDLQKPDHLWIGCADSRVPANEIVGLAPGELFVQRNVANLVRPDDPNCLAVLQYAVDILQVSHVIVCGHYGCGGVKAAFGAELEEPLEGWIGPIRALRRAHAAELDALAQEEARWRRLCELNVRDQVRRLRELTLLRRAWARGRRVAVHGWIYDLRDGLLRDLEISATGD